MSCRMLIGLLAGITFSTELVNEIYQELAKRPYNEVAPLIAKMQAELAKSTQAPAQAPNAPPQQEAPK